MALRFVIYSIPLFLIALSTPIYGQQQSIPDPVNAALDHLLSLSPADAESQPDKQKISEIIEFVRDVSAGTGIVLNERESASGAFFAFDIDADLMQVLDYAYNPDIPAYVTMPSSLQDHQWLTPQIIDALKKLPLAVEAGDELVFLRGREQESITPDTNTGGYYLYSQDRIIMVLPGPTGPVLISATSQTDASEVGRKGCVAGDDADWSYLFSEEPGINKTGLGWVDSYMYYAYSIIVYVADTANNRLHAGSFKWLNAGWAKINMVKSSHILEGIKRFAVDFKAVLESPDLPRTYELEQKYQELQQMEESQLRLQVAAHFEKIKKSGALETCPNSFQKMVSSGEYLNKIDRDEMVRIMLLDYVKSRLGRQTSSASVTQAGENVSVQSTVSETN
ncbi:MAG: hypothetical protein QNJ17_00280 [Desulfocapsaceae bacterium]|nr:hypothetical protein [Desulfocapsaceae bacterium]